MAKVKCEFCGAYIDECEESCSICGAINENHTRVVYETPRTIEELRAWYISKNLPPEEVTRFFIGKDIKSAKAFGIYKNSAGQFIVYKNKRDGTRAIRYKGTDEAYAVNELYLKLKEEILNQKAHNVARYQQQGAYIAETPKPAPFPSQWTQAEKRQYQRKKEQSFILRSIKMVIMVWLICGLTMGAFFWGLDLFFDEGVQCGYYHINNQTLLYYDKCHHDWWQYDQHTHEWQIVLDSNKDVYMEGVAKDNHIESLCDFVTETLKLAYTEDFEIDQNRQYIDAGHHQEPDYGYYVYEDNLYYYLNDRYSEYGNTNNDGWYIYNDEDDSWSYYGSYEDRSLFDDEMWYDPSTNYSGRETIYESVKIDYDWDPSSFDSTTWYQNAENNEKAYNDHITSRNDDDDDWDYDSDYDWDDDYDWDYDDTDWDSDW